MTLTQMEQVELGGTIANVRDNDVPPLAAVCERGKLRVGQDDAGGKWVGQRCLGKPVCLIKNIHLQQ